MRQLPTAGWIDRCFRGTGMRTISRNSLSFSRYFTVTFSLLRKAWWSRGQSIALKQYVSHSSRLFPFVMLEIDVCEEHRFCPSRRNIAVLAAVRSCMTSKLRFALQSSTSSLLYPVWLRGKPQYVSFIHEGYPFLVGTREPGFLHMSSLLFDKPKNSPVLDKLSSMDA